MFRMVFFGIMVSLLCLSQQSIVFPYDKFVPTDQHEITIAFAGDLLMHMPLVNAARVADDEYDFNPLLEYITPYLADADYTVANLETRLAGAERGYSGYPCFNSPASLAEALRETGIDLLGTANNHSLDKGYSGLVATLDNLDKASVAHFGTYRSTTEQEQPCIVNVCGLDVAFLNYTYGTNGIPMPKDHSYCVNIIDKTQIIEEAVSARKAGADYVMAFLHFGLEYERFPNESQRMLAHQLLDSGIDAVIGAHPHVVQPCEWYTSNADNIARPIAYSLGNFASNQRSRYRDSGIILYVTLTICNDKVENVEMSYLPVYVSKYSIDGAWKYRILPVHPDIKLDLDPPLSMNEQQRMDVIWNELFEHVACEPHVWKLEDTFHTHVQ